MKSLSTFSLFCFYLLKPSIGSVTDVDNKVKIPDALTPDQYEKVDKLVNNQEYIENEIKDQLKRLGELHSTITNMVGKGRIVFLEINASGSDPTDKLRSQSLINDDSIIYNHSTLDFMEAPVIFLEPPLVLPKDQIKTDEEVESFLKKSGLESETKEKSKAPLEITSIDEANASEKVIKSKVEKLRRTREDMFKRMRKLSLDIPGDNAAETEFKKLKEGIDGLDRDLKEEIHKLTQVELVKKALINKKGPGSDAEQGEEDLESREQEMERDQEDEEVENEREEEDEGEEEEDF